MNDYADNDFPEPTAAEITEVAGAIEAAYRRERAAARRFDKKCISIDEAVDLASQYDVDGAGGSSKSREAFEFLNPRDEHNSLGRALATWDDPERTLIRREELGHLDAWAKGQSKLIQAMFEHIKGDDPNYKAFSKEHNVTPAYARILASRLHEKARQEMGRDKPRRAKVRDRRPTYRKWPDIGKVVSIVFKHWRTPVPTATATFKNTEGAEANITSYGSGSILEVIWETSLRGFGGRWFGGRYQARGEWTKTVKDEDRVTPFGDYIPTTLFQTVNDLGDWERPYAASETKDNVRTWSVDGRKVARLFHVNTFGPAELSALADCAIFYHQLLRCYGTPGATKLPFHLLLVAVLDQLKDRPNRAMVLDLLNKPIVLTLIFGPEKTEQVIVLCGGSPDNTLRSWALAMPALCDRLNATALIQ